MAFKMKSGSPFQRNFGVGSSPMKDKQPYDKSKKITEQHNRPGEEEWAHNIAKHPAKPRPPRGRKEDWTRKEKMESGPKTKSPLEHKAATMTNLQGSQEGGVSHKQLKRHDRRHSQGEEHNSDGDWGKEENTPAPKRDEYGDLLNNENYVDGVKKEPALPMKSPLEQTRYSTAMGNIENMKPRERKKAMKIARGETEGGTYHDPTQRILGTNRYDYGTGRFTQHGEDKKVPGIFASKKKKIDFLKTMEGNRQGMRKLPYDAETNPQGNMFATRPDAKPSGNAMSRDLFELYESEGIDPATMEPLEGGPKVKSKNTKFGYHDEEGNVIPQ